MSPSANEIEQHNRHYAMKHNQSPDFSQERPIYVSSPPEGPYRYSDPRQMLQYQQQSPMAGNYEYETARYSTPATSPPTPLLDQQRYKTRSELVVQSTSQGSPLKPQARVEKAAPTAKKAKKERMKSERVGKLNKPLSEMTSDWRAVTFDIESYVNRTPEERRKEIHVGKNPGKIKRPMNSFMLYRKAFQNRTKDWCLQNNHQVVSQVCGDSWPLEPEEVREQFNDWARIERINHQNAHPDYKFTPAKPGQPKGGKRKSGSPESDESDLEEFDWQGRTRRSKKSQPAPPSVTSNPQGPVAYPTTRSAYHYDSRDGSLEASYAPAGYHPSSYQASNGGRYPSSFDPSRMEQGNYYQHYTHNHNSMPGVEDVIYHDSIAPRPRAFPGHHQDYESIIQQQYHQDQIDPSLLSLGPHTDFAGFAAPQSDSMYFPPPHPQEQQWLQQSYMNDQYTNNAAMPYFGIDPTLESTQIQDAHVEILKGNQDGWQVNLGGDDFDKWIDEA